VEASALQLALVAGIGGLTGGVLALAGGAAQAHHATVARRSRQAHERQLASYQTRVNAYDEILAFFARTRAEVDTVILEDKAWDEAVADPDQRARLDALMHVHGSDAFRELAKEWRQVFDQTRYTLTRWRWLDDPANPNADETASVRSQLEKDRAKLQGVMDRLQEQARRDVHKTAFEPAERKAATTSPIRVLGTLMIAAAILLVTAPAWAGLGPMIARTAGAHRELVAFGLLVSGFVIVLGGGLVTRRRVRETE
jgi:hypothetical protein